MVKIKKKDRRSKNNDPRHMFGLTEGKAAPEVVPTGKFAADMRVHIGGYGRPNHHWAKDHPWHFTDAATIEEVTNRDKLEEGVDATELLPGKGNGQSRAALKRKKRQGKGPNSITTAVPSLSLDEMTVASTDREDSKGKAEPQSAKSAPEEAVNTHSQQPLKNKEEKRAGKTSKAPSATNNPKEQKKKTERPKVTSTVRADVKKKEERPQKPQSSPPPPMDSSGLDPEAMSDLFWEDLAHGSGASPSPGEQITIRYRATLGKPGSTFGKGLLTFKVDCGQVIVGLNEAVKSMKEGGRRKIVIPPELGYMQSAKIEKIPPGSTLHFDVELIRVGKRKRGSDDEEDATIAVPLPSSFTRKKAKKGDQKQRVPGVENDKKKSKRRRRGGQRVQAQRARQREEETGNNE